MVPSTSQHQKLKDSTIMFNCPHLNASKLKENCVSTKKTPTAPEEPRLGAICLKRQGAAASGRLGSQHSKSRSFRD